MKKRKRKPFVKNLPKNLKCPFCESKTVPSYENYKELKKFISDRSKIKAKIYTGVCNKHQKVLEKEIKRARYLGLLPNESE